MKRNRRELYLYYGLALLMTLFIAAGLLTALRGAGDGKGGERHKKISNDKKNDIQPQKKRSEINNPNIRVLIMTAGYKNIVHPSVTVLSEKGMILSYGEDAEEWNTGDPLTINPDDSRFQKGSIRIQPREGEIALASIERGCGTPSYGGIIELRTTAEGIAVINELPVETYLCRVVPSEMPSSYELEALKAQAVCARSYAYRQMEDYAYPEYEAHVNDSTDFQVYGNSLPQESSSRAVEETAGQVVRHQGNVVTTYYYSTSCGRTTSMEAWGSEASEENSYLKSVEVKGEEGDYEKDLPWYRWEAVIPAGVLSDLIGLNTGRDVGALDRIEVIKSGPGGVALEISAVGDKGSVSVETENKIRKALGGNGYQITKQDGTAVKSSALLPSAFFAIERSGDQFIIKGGGYGHGIGMSQNGANQMAKQGKDYKEILSLFYQGITVE